MAQTKKSLWLIILALAAALFLGVNTLIVGAIAIILYILWKRK